MASNLFPLRCHPLWVPPATAEVQRVGRLRGGCNGNAAADAQQHHWPRAEVLARAGHRWCAGEMTTGDDGVTIKCDS